MKITNSTPGKFYTTKELAKLLGLNAQTIYEWSRRGYIAKPFKLNSTSRKFLFPADAIAQGEAHKRHIRSHLTAVQGAARRIYPDPVNWSSARVD